MAQKIKKGDRVIVLVGRDKGMIGEVMKVVTASNRAVVAGVNKVKRHTAASQTTAGGIIEREASIHLSNLAHVDPKDDKPTRVGFKQLDGDRKVRIAKRSGEVIDA